MKAVMIQRAGDPDVMELQEVERPVPGPGEVLVEIQAAGVNHRDVWVRMGLQGQSFPYCPGSDAAGVVVEAGPEGGRRQAGRSETGGPDAWLGRRVLIQPGWGCGRCPACLSGRDPLCPSYRIFDGSYAQYRAVPVEQLVDIGDLPFTAAASLPVPYLTAWQMVKNAIGLQPAETLLVSGASGGVGTAAMQIAHLLGARAVGLTRSAEKARRLEELGFDEVVRVEGDWPEAVLERLGGPVDAAVDNVGREMWGHWPRLLRRGGALAFCGTTTGSEVTLDLRAYFAKSLRLHGAYTGPRRDLLRIVQLAREGRLQPVIDRTYPLSEAAAAHQRMEEQQHVGGIVLTTE